MKTPAVKSMFAAVAAVLFAVTPLVGRSVTIDVTKFQQRYPWNGLVDVDYTITLNQGESELDSAKCSVEISVVNNETAVTNVAHVFRSGTLPVSAGAHRVTWDANAEGIDFNSQDVKIFAEIVRYAEKYMVIDVSDGPTATVYPVTYLHGAPEGGFTNETYRGNKIALRLIPPGSFVMGSPTTEPGRTSFATREVQHAVAITKPFYIGVFEITQKQYEKVMDAEPSQFVDEYRPVELVTYNNIRGTATTGTHQYEWPWTNEVAAASFMGILRSKCKEWDGANYTKDVEGIFDLPTDAQWEYACRAGTTSAYNNGGSTDDDLKRLGCYGSASTVVVGSYAPNAWGLYDMHGNVWEWCLDWFKEDVQNIENPSLDPVGGATGSERVLRGGSWYNADAFYCRSAYRHSALPTTAIRGYGFGFRLARTLP